jgi:malate permease and related proteins
MIEFWPVASKVLGVFLVIFAGAATRRIGWLTKESDRTLASLTTNLLLPAFYFERILQGPQLSHSNQAWLPPLLGFLCTSLGFLVAGLFAYAGAAFFNFKDNKQVRAFVFSVGICNYGFIPIPLAEYFYPSAVVTLMIHNIGVELAIWSLGILILAGEWRNNWRRVFLSPPLMAVACAMLLRQFGVQTHIPEAITTAIHSLGQCAIPLGLMLSGAIIIDYAKQSDLTEDLCITSSAVVLRLLVVPMIILSLALLIPAGLDLKQVLLLQAAMPAATLPVVLCRLYGQDVGTAVRVVIATSLCCLLTMPLWLVYGAQWLGVIYTPSVR